jgi:hypothetical protein
VYMSLLCCSLSSPSAHDDHLEVTVYMKSRTFAGVLCMGGYCIGAWHCAHMLTGSRCCRNNGLWHVVLQGSMDLALACERIMILSGVWVSSCFLQRTLEQITLYVCMCLDEFHHPKAQRLRGNISPNFLFFISTSLLCVCMPPLALVAYISLYLSLSLSLSHFFPMLEKGI